LSLSLKISECEGIFAVANFVLTNVEVANLETVLSDVLQKLALEELVELVKLVQEEFVPVDLAVIIVVLVVIFNFIFRLLLRFVFFLLRFLIVIFVAAIVFILIFNVNLSGLEEAISSLLILLLLGEGLCHAHANDQETCYKDCCSFHSCKFC
jgi:hypothetical protein